MTTPANENIPLPSLDPRTRAIIDEFNLYFVPGASIKECYKKIGRKRSLSFSEFKKILEKELGINLGSSKVFEKKIHKQVDITSKINHATIISNEEKIEG